MKTTSLENQKNDGFEKNNLHPRNLHKYRYDFDDLVKTLPDLKSFIFINKYQVESIDFANADAVKLLNKAILMHFYGIKHWDIPAHYLCPPVPGRADYIHYLADLLAISNDNKIPIGKKVSVLDIGVGANCIYPIIGIKEYGWAFVGSDVDEIAVNSAKNIIEANNLTKGKATIKKQLNKDAILDGIISETDFFDIVMCNPPFHTSADEAMESNRRKITNLAEKTGKQIDNEANNQNFGGQNHELWYEGGEKAFIIKMVKESVKYKNQVFWFTSLVSNKNNLSSINNALKNVKITKTKTIEMAQGQKISRFIAWSFQNSAMQANWAKLHW